LDIYELEKDKIYDRKDSKKSKETNDMDNYATPM